MNNKSDTDCPICKIELEEQRFCDFEDYLGIQEESLCQRHQNEEINHFDIWRKI